MSDDQMPTFPFLRLPPELQQLVLNKHYEERWIVNCFISFGNTTLSMDPFLVSKPFAAQARRAIATSKAGMYFVRGSGFSQSPQHFDQGISDVSLPEHAFISPQALKQRFRNLRNIYLSSDAPGAEYVLRTTLLLLPVKAYKLLNREADFEICHAVGRTLLAMISISEHDLDDVTVRWEYELEAEHWPEFELYHRHLGPSFRTTLYFELNHTGCRISRMTTRKAIWSVEDEFESPSPAVYFGEEETEDIIEHLRIVATGSEAEMTASGARFTKL